MKVKPQSDGSVRITEQDGDQFTVSAAGMMRPVTKQARMGSRSARSMRMTAAPSGAYYGRGYVQLT